MGVRDDCHSICQLDRVVSGFGSHAINFSVKSRNGYVALMLCFSLSWPESYHFCGCLWSLSLLMVQ